MEAKRDYYPIIMISAGILLYILSEFIEKYPYHLILVTISSAIFLLLLFEPFLIYLRNTHQNSKKKFGAIIGAIIVIIVSIILYFLIGSGTAFYVTIATFIIMYSLGMIDLFSSNGKKKETK